MSLEVLGKLQGWRPGVASLISKFGERVKIAGSALTEGVTPNDIDVFTDNQQAYAELVHFGHVVGIHPSLIGEDHLEDLHDRMSFLNCCLTVDGNGREQRSERWHKGLDLRFNPASRSVFPHPQLVVGAAVKLTKRGYTVDRRELHLANAVLLKDPDYLVRIVEDTIPHRLLEAIHRHDAIVAGGFFRSLLMGEEAKDIDVFATSRMEYHSLCADFAEFAEEVQFAPSGMRVNLRKFRSEGRDYDVIDYSFVQSKEHVVETFDFTANMLWYDHSERAVRGSSRRPSRIIFDDVFERRLVVGDNLWYRAGLGRALKRWQRFRRMGFVPSERDIEKYRDYVRLFRGAQQERKSA